MDRNGGLEIALAQNLDAGSPSDIAGGSLIWRVRILTITDIEIEVECPTAMGRPIDIAEGTHLVAAITIGQNRWMFHTSALGVKPRSRPGDAGVLRLAAPTGVERCQRRNFYRISTTELTVPHVECWPVLEPASVPAAEVANRAAVRDGGRSFSPHATTDVESLSLPEVGPTFSAKLVNVGGGGAGLLIDRAEASSLDRSRMLWLRVDLRPHIATPLGMAARVVHTHLDSAGNVYAGVAFEFGTNTAHRDFIVDQICDYAAKVQAMQGRQLRKAG